MWANMTKKVKTCILPSTVLCITLISIGYFLPFYFSFHAYINVARHTVSWVKAVEILPPYPLMLPTSPLPPAPWGRYGGGVDNMVYIYCPCNRTVDFSKMGNLSLWSDCQGISFVSGRFHVLAIVPSVFVIVPCSEFSGFHAHQSFVGAVPDFRGQQVISQWIAFLCFREKSKS